MKNWFIWWIARKTYFNGKWSDSGTWYGMKYLTDREVWQEEFDIGRSNLDATLYRFRWNGEEWIWDKRTNVELMASGATF
jgi:hypothetical protein